MYKSRWPLTSKFFNVCVDLRAGQAHTKPLNAVCWVGLTPHRSSFLFTWLCLYFIKGLEQGKDTVLKTTVYRLDIGKSSSLWRRFTHNCHTMIPLSLRLAVSLNENTLLRQIWVQVSLRWSKLLRLKLCPKWWSLFLPVLLPDLETKNN